MNHAPRLCVLSAFVLFSLSCASSARAQATAALHGTVTDPSGAAVPNATVHLINSAANFNVTTTTDGYGAYTFLRQMPGAYTLTVDAKGFAHYEQTEVQLAADQPRTIDVQLKISQAQASVTVRDQSYREDVAAETRAFPGVGPGVRAIRRSVSGNYYILTAPGAVVAIYSPEGKKIGQVPTDPTGAAAIVYGEDLDLDSTGHVYVADRGANAIKIYGPDGRLSGRIPVLAPVSVAAVTGGEVAVSSLSAKHLIEVFDRRGRLMRSFGNTSSSSEDTPTAPTVSQGWFSDDSSGHMYFALTDLSDPTIRKYDQFGFAAYQVSVPAEEFTGAQVGKYGVVLRPRRLGRHAAGGDDSGTSATLPPGLGMGGGGFGMHHEGFGGDTGGGEADGAGRPDHPYGGMHGRAMRDLSGTVKISKRDNTPETKPMLDAIGADPATQEVWASVGNTLMHFDKDGNRLATYRIFTNENAPINPNAILVENDRLLIAADPFGIFVFDRPDRPQPPASDKP